MKGLGEAGYLSKDSPVFWLFIGDSKLLTTCCSITSILKACCHGSLMAFMNLPPNLFILNTTFVTNGMPLGKSKRRPCK